METNNPCSSGSQISTWKYPWLNNPPKYAHFVFGES